MKIRLNDIRHLFDGLRYSEQDWDALTKAQTMLGKENPLVARYGEHGEWVEVSVSEFADQFAGQFVAQLRIKDVMEAQKVINFALEKLCQ